MHTVHGTIRGSCWKARVRLTHGVETTKDIFDLFLSPFNYTVSSYGSFSSYGVTKRLVMKLNTIQHLSVKMHGPGVLSRHRSILMYARGS